MWNHKNRFSWRVAAEVFYLMAAPIEGTLPYLFPPKGPKLDFSEVKRLFQAMAVCACPKPAVFQVMCGGKGTRSLCASRRRKDEKVLEQVFALGGQYRLRRELDAFARFRA